MTSQSRARLIALDWGTTSCRAFLLGDDGVVLAERRQQSGVKALSTSAETAGTPRTQAFERAFEQLCGDWLDASPKLPVIACGMVGSNRGWVETPYRSLPVDLVANGLVMSTVAARDGSLVHIIPGLIADQAVPDVIRGEETQVLGALGVTAGADNADIDRIVLLPGTHSKWVRATGTTVTAFKTFMTGEFFALLTTESTLAQLATAAGETDWAAFDTGLDVAASTAGGGGILATAFSARTLAMTGGIAADQVEDYLSGLLIGDEVAAAAALWQGVDVDEVFICGEADLSERYRRALVRFALPTPREVSDSAATGMWRIALAAGLVGHDDPSRPAPAASPTSPTASAPLRTTPLPRARKLTEASNATPRPYIGLIAILRGLTVSDAVSVGECLYEAGYRSLEVPLNSPDPLPTISALKKALPADCLVGAGTVLTVEQVRACHEAGAQIIVSPNTDTAVIAETVRLGMLSFPGAATPSDAFAAIGAGATSVKIFPADQVGINGLKAWTAVVPKHIDLIPVGGVDAANIGEWVAAGATGFGIGSSLYKPGIAVEDLRQRAVAMMAAWTSALDSTRKSE